MTTPSVRLRLPQTPLVITLGNLKGGATKTTSAFFLAVFFALVCGLKVKVIDADPLSQTGFSWFRRLKKGGLKPPFDLEAYPTQAMDDKIDEVAEAGYDVIIIDAGGESDAIFKAAVRRTHELILMTATSPSEYNRVPATYDAASEAAAKVSHNINVRVLLTKVPVVNKKNKDTGDMENVSIEYRKARHWLEDAGYPVFANYVSANQWYRLAADGEVGDGADNPLIDIGEYLEVGQELVSKYMITGEAA